MIGLVFFYIYIFTYISYLLSHYLFIQLSGYHIQLIEYDVVDFHPRPMLPLGVPIDHRGGPEAKCFVCKGLAGFGSHRFGPDSAQTWPESTQAGKIDTLSSN